MKFSTLLTAAIAVGVSSALAAPGGGHGRDGGHDGGDHEGGDGHDGYDGFSIFGKDMGRGNKFGAPKEPWQPGSKPGWYFGKYPGKHGDLPCLHGPICNALKFFPKYIQCPPPPPPPTSDGYHQTFSNLTGATQADSYLTFGLVDTVADCKAMCNGVTGCNFVNTYHDVNGKDGSTQLTCSLFGTCQDASTATNTGGQTQPDGSINYITNSDGWCKA